MIPKIIHFVWVGENKKPALVEKCIASWKKYLPDYEIIEWDNDRFLSLNNNYARQAFENKKWAFASDYIRLYALYKFGGVYLDSDLEVTQSLDNFLSLDFFSGYEKYNKSYQPITALMGASKGNAIIKDLLDEYDDIYFVKSDGSFDQTTNTQRISAYFKKNYRLSEPLNPKACFSLIPESSYIYPYFYFCTPKDGEVNYSIHHFNGSWIDPYGCRKLIDFSKYTLSVLKKRKNKTSNKIEVGANEEVIMNISVFPGWKLILTKKYNIGDSL